MTFTSKQMAFYNRIYSLASRLARVPNRRLSAASHSQPLVVPQTNQSELSNGVRVVSEDIGGQTTTIGVWLETGTRYETEATSGVTSLVLRSLLASRADLETRLARMGAVVSAGVERDKTFISLRCLSSQTSSGVELLGDLVSNCTFGPEVERQKNEMWRAMRELDTDYESVVMNGLHAMAFQDTPLALPIIGKSEAIRALDSKDLINYVNTHFKGPRIVVSVAGDVDHNQIVQSVDKHFGKITNIYDKSEIPEITKCRYTGSDLRIRDDAMPLAHIALAVESAGLQSPDYWSLMLASSLMGSWDQTFGGGTDCSNYLGLCSATDNLTNSYRSFNLGYRESGLFGVYMVCERMKQEDAVWHLTYEWKRFCTELTDNELRRAKNTLVTDLMRRNEGSANVSATIGRQVLDFGRRVPLDELQANIVGLSASKVRDVCNEYIWDRCPVVSAVGPVEQLEDYENIRSKFYWFRY